MASLRTSNNSLTSSTSTYFSQGFLLYHIGLLQLLMILLYSGLIIGCKGGPLLLWPLTYHLSTQKRVTLQKKEWIDVL
jgi:hypothetical protein